MECFSVYENKIERRLDPVFYCQIYVQNIKNIKNSRYEVKTLKEISEKIVDGPFGSQLKVEEYTKKGIPIIRVKDIKGGKLLEDSFVYITREKQEQLKRSKVYPGDIVLTKAGSIGNATIVPPHIKEANITSHLAKIKIKEGINPKYICEYLNTKYGKLQIFRLGNKTTRPELNTSEVASILIILPPLEIQNKIVKEAELRMQKAEQLQQEAKEIINKAKEEVEKIILR